MDQILEALANQNLSDTLETERIDNRDELLEKYIVKPLTPNISDKNFTLYNNDNEKTKMKELLARLSYTVNKLNQYERNIDKNRCTDEVSCLDAEDNFTKRENRPAKTNVLPENVKENINSIIQSAQDYVTKLNYQLKDLDNADQEVRLAFVYLFYFITHNILQLPLVFIYRYIYAIPINIRKFFVR